jgi:hypothetical protein
MAETLTPDKITHFTVNEFLYKVNPRGLRPLQNESTLGRRRIGANLMLWPHQVMNILTKQI